MFQHLEVFGFQSLKFIRLFEEIVQLCKNFYRKIKNTENEKLQIEKLRLLKFHSYIYITMKKFYTKQKKSVIIQKKKNF